jgi:antitoxin component of MazEF toxin-antitoxin module
MELNVKAKRWGNSIAFILPKAVVETKKINENDEITIVLASKPLAGELFGKFPRSSKKSAQQIKDEIRRGWETSEHKPRWKKYD